MKIPSKVAINGFGRIGRKITRLALDRKDIQIVAINDLSIKEQIAHLLKYDSVHGVLKKDVRLEGNRLILDQYEIKLFSEKDPVKLPWKEHQIDIVHECTGVFTERSQAQFHLDAGARKVIISAPSKDPDFTICMGVNEKNYDPKKHHVVSNASCTTNCLATMVKVLDDAFGVVRGTMLTVHSYTNDQQVLDLAHKDFRRARAAAMSQIPTTTGAAKAVGQVLPHLKGKLDGLAIRVPTPNVSVVDFTGELKKPTNIKEINSAFETASRGLLRGVLDVSHLPLVSIDFNGNFHSSIVDLELTQVIEGNLVKVIGWYDNESGYSARMIDLSIHMARAPI